MAKERKSPQEKKELSYQRDHFTFGWHSSRQFPKTWKRKKQNTNRAYRRSSQLLLAQIKPEMEAEDVELSAEDLTANRFSKSISRKRLQKTGTVNLVEKIRKKLEQRDKSADRKSRERQHYDQAAGSAMHILGSLRGDALSDFLHRLDSRLRSQEQRRPKLAADVNQALGFALAVLSRSPGHADALARNPTLASAWRIWLAQAERLLKHDRKTVARKNNRKRMLGST